MRGDGVNLFGFVDATDTLGLNSNINWSHRFSQQLFLYARVSLQPFADAGAARI